jgi:hypothetical protein
MLICKTTKNCPQNSEIKCRHYYNTNRKYKRNTKLFKMILEKTKFNFKNPDENPEHAMGY